MEAYNPHASWRCCTGWYGHHGSSRWIFPTQKHFMALSPCSVPPMSEIDVMAYLQTAAARQKHWYFSVRQLSTILTIIWHRIGTDVFFRVKSCEVCYSDKSKTKPRVTMNRKHLKSVKLCMLFRTIFNSSFPLPLFKLVGYEQIVQSHGILCLCSLVIKIIVLS